MMWDSPSLGVGTRQVSLPPSHERRFHRLPSWVLFFSRFSTLDTCSSAWKFAPNGCLQKPQLILQNVETLLPDTTENSIGLSGAGFLVVGIPGIFGGILCALLLLQAAETAFAKRQLGYLSCFLFHHPRCGVARFFYVNHGTRTLCGPSRSGEPQRACNPTTRRTHRSIPGVPTPRNARSPGVLGVPFFREARKKSLAEYPWSCEPQTNLRQARRSRRASLE